jgi:hypothetical protein
VGGRTREEKKGWGRTANVISPPSLAQPVRVFLQHSLRGARYREMASNSLEVRPQFAPEAKLALSIAGGIAAIFIPGAGLVQPVAAYVLDKYVRRAETILIDEINRGGITQLDDERAEALIPMAYKFFEAAKEGEYEHNLRVLAELLKSELVADTPDVSAFARMARRLEALTLTELKVIALTQAAMASRTTAPQEGPGPPKRPWVSALTLFNDPNNRDRFDYFVIQEVLSDLAGRGLLVADGAASVSKHEEYYYASSSFQSLIDKAEGSIAGAA